MVRHLFDYAQRDNDGEVGFAIMIEEAPCIPGSARSRPTDGEPSLPPAGVLSRISRMHAAERRAWLAHAVR